MPETDLDYYYLRCDELEKELQIARDRYQEFKAAVFDVCTFSTVAHLAKRLNWDECSSGNTYR